MRRSYLIWRSSVAFCSCSSSSDFVLLSLASVAFLFCSSSASFLCKRFTSLVAFSRSVKVFAYSLLFSFASSMSLSSFAFCRFSLSISSFLSITVPPSFQCLQCVGKFVQVGILLLVFLEPLIVVLQLFRLMFFLGFQLLSLFGLLP